MILEDNNPSRRRKLGDPRRQLDDLLHLSLFLIGFLCYFTIWGVQTKVLARVAVLDAEVHKSLSIAYSTRNTSAIVGFVAGGLLSIFLRRFTGAWREETVR